MYSRNKALNFFKKVVAVPNPTSLLVAWKEILGTSVVYSFGNAASPILGAQKNILWKKTWKSMMERKWYSED